MMRDFVVAHQGPIVALSALAGANGLIFGLPALGVDPLAFPMPVWLDSSPARVVLLFFAFLWAVIALALGLKLVESGQVARWPRVSGVIVRSQPGFRTITRAQGMPEERRVADVAYEFRIPGPDGRPQVVTGTRIDISEERDPGTVEATLARYPVGRAVFVHFDPAQPERAVLETGADDLRKTVAGLFWLALGLGVIALPVMALVTDAARVGAWVSERPFAVGAGVAGLFAWAALGSAWKIAREDRMVARWPSVQGRVVMTQVTPYRTGQNRTQQRRRGRQRTVALPGGASVTSGSGTGGTIMYLPTVEYAYEVAGQRHLSRSLRLNLSTGMDEAAARALVARYPVDAPVSVRYDPADPGRSALEVGGGPARGFAIAGFVFLAVAIGAGLMALR